MSYCRKNPGISDVYVYEGSGGMLHCCGCEIADHDFHTDSPIDLAVHLREHEVLGQMVPAHCWKRLGLCAEAGYLLDAWMRRGKRRRRFG